MNSDLINWDESKNHKMLKSICDAAGLNEDEFNLFKYVCTERRLNPVLKHIYPIKRANKLTIQISIDGYRLLASRTGRYVPGKATTFAYTKDGQLLSATAYIKKKVGAEWHEISAEVFFEEYCPMYNGKPGGLWGKMRRSQLAKCAEVVCFRKGFPEEASGMYATEEMEQADPMPPDISEEPVINVKDNIAELKTLLSQSNLPTDNLETCLEQIIVKTKQTLAEASENALQSLLTFVPYYEKWVKANA